MEIIIGAIGAGILAGILYLMIFAGAVAGRKGLELGERGLDKAKEIAKEIQDKSKSDNQRILDVDEEKFLIAQKEIDNNEQSESLWIKAKVLARGDKNITEVEYIKLRANQLEKEEAN
tara:strand:- start:46 stop:399 length:354 start_codon:yes stop_codon:yes gene_type:complete